MAKQVALMLLALLFLATPAWAAPPGQLSALESWRLLQGRADVLILDVRTPQEYREAHLAGSLLIPIDQVAQRLGEIPRERPILVYCAVGSRSSQVANYLGRLGYPEVYNLRGGIWSWQSRRLPVSRGAP